MRNLCCLWKIFTFLYNCPLVVASPSNAFDFYIMFASLLIINRPLAKVAKTPPPTPPRKRLRCTHKSEIARLTRVLPHPNPPRMYWGGN